MLMRVVGRAVHALGAQFLEQIPRPAGGHPFENPNAKPQIVGILANVDALLYDLLILSLWRAGFTPFPLSPRNSVAALRHLMIKTGCDVLIGSIPDDEEGGRGSALEIVTERLVESLDVDITLIPIPDIFDFLPSLNPSPSSSPPTLANPSSPPPSAPSTDPAINGGEAEVERLPPIPYPQCQSWTSIIIHSSGSTSFPKPISFPQKHTLQWSHFTWFGEQDLGTPSPAPILRQKDRRDSNGDQRVGVNGANVNDKDGGNVDGGWSGGEVTSSGMSLPGFHAIGVGCQIGVPFTSKSTAPSPYSPFSNIPLLARLSARSLPFSFSGAIPFRSLRFDFSVLSSAFHMPLSRRSPLLIWSRLTVILSFSSLPFASLLFSSPSLPFSSLLFASLHLSFAFFRFLSPPSLR